MDDPRECHPNDENSKRLLREGLAGCTEEEARARLWEVARSLGLDPTELLGLDVD